MIEFARDQCPSFDAQENSVGSEKPFRALGGCRVDGQSIEPIAYLRSSGNFTGGVRR